MSTITLTAEECKRALAAVVRSMSDDETRPHLACVLVEAWGATCRFVTTDGHRLARYDAECDPVLDDTTEAKHVEKSARVSIMIPRGAVDTLTRALKANRSPPGSVTIDTGSITVAVCGGLTTIPLSDSGAQFPSYEQVVPARMMLASWVGFVGCTPSYIVEAMAAFQDAFVPKSSGTRKRSSAPGLCVTMQPSGELDPIVFTSEQVPRLLVLVMPARVTAQGEVLPGGAVPVHKPTPKLEGEPVTYAGLVESVRKAS